MRKSQARQAAVSAFGAALVLVLAGAASSCPVKSADHSLVRAYSSAEPITPTWNPDIKPPEPMWNREIDLGGVSVKVSARCCVGGRFAAQYSDEPSTRIVFTPGDYVYPSELRVAPPNHVVYGRASGLAGGITQTTKIFAYDLKGRRLLDSAEVDPRLLPPVQEPLSPRPSR